MIEFKCLKCGRVYTAVKSIGCICGGKIFNVKYKENLNIYRREILNGGGLK